MKLRDLFEQLWLARQQQRDRAAWFRERTTPKGGNVPKAVVEKRRAKNRRARASRKRNRGRS